MRLAVGPIVRELSSRFVWKQDSTREFVKTQTTERPQIPYQQKRKNIDTVTNPAPMTTIETNAKTEHRLRRRVQVGRTS